MARRAFVINLKPGTEEEYRERHRRVWPDVLRVLKRYGVYNYSIFQQDTVLFAYMEIDGDFEQLFKKLHEDPSSIRWREYMSDIIMRDEHMGFRFLEEVFHLD